MNQLLSAAHSFLHPLARGLFAIGSITVLAACATTGSQSNPAMETPEFKALAMDICRQLNGKQASDVMVMAHPEYDSSRTSETRHVVSEASITGNTLNVTILSMTNSKNSRFPDIPTSLSFYYSIPLNKITYISVHNYKKDVGVLKYDQSLSGTSFTTRMLTKTARTVTITGSGKSWGKTSDGDSLRLPVGLPVFSDFNSANKFATDLKRLAAMLGSTVELELNKYGQ